MSNGDSDQQDLLEFLYACPVGLVEIDAAGNIALINPHAMKHLLPIAGKRGADNLFAIFERCAPELRNMMDGFVGQHGVICEGHRIAVDFKAAKGSPDLKYLACTLVKIDENRAIATFQDVSVQVAQERRLKQAEAWFGSLLSGVNHYAVLSITPDGIVDGTNASFTQQTGHACEDVIGRSLGSILSPPPASGFLPLIEQLRIAERDGWYLDEDWQERRDGERYWCQRLFAARTNVDGSALNGYTVVLRDVVHQSADTVELRRMLTCVQLTGAANRTHFLQVFARERRRWCEVGRPLSLILVDIDHFKTVNDTYGHPAGDTVLRTLSEGCMAALRPADLFARLGGEEFAVLLPDTALDEAMIVAEKLRRVIAEARFEALSSPFSVTASFGCVTSRDSLIEIDAIVAEADRNLYAAKRAGRNRVCSAAAMPVAA